MHWHVAGTSARTNAGDVVETLIFTRARFKAHLRTTSSPTAGYYVRVAAAAALAIDHDAECEQSNRYFKCNSGKRLACRYSR